MLKVSGEALSGTSGFGIDPEVVQSIAREVAEASLAGVQVAVVKGANMPEIESLLDEHAPTSPDADVLEENPMFVQRAEEKAAAEAAAQAALMGENE